MKIKNENINGIIYMVTNKENNKKYIGATTSSLTSRKQDHIQKANAGSGYDFQQAIWIYGKDAFNWIEIDTASNLTELAQKEKYYIEKYNSFRDGYNSDSGGGFKKPIYQYTLTGKLVNTFDCLQDAANVVHVDKKAISKICLGVNQTFDGYLWSYRYQEPYQPIKKDQRFKEVMQLSENKEFLATFSSIAEASRITGIHKSSIAKCCRGERKMVGDYIFKYGFHSEIIDSKISDIQKKEESHKFINSSNYIYTSSSSSIIYDTDNKSMSINNGRLYNITDENGLNANNDYRNYAQFAPFMQKSNTISIPKKVKYNLEKYVSKKSLKSINGNVDVAIEMCLLIISNLSSTYYRNEKWKALNSIILHSQTKWKSDNTWNYKKIIDLLKIGTKKKGAFIEVKINKKGVETFQKRISSKEYKLTDTYLDIGLEEYELKNETLISNREKYLKRKATTFYNNPICQNLIHIYKQIEMRNKHGNSHWKDYKNRSFVEDNIKLYLNLTKNGLKIFSIGNEKSGGRVVDSFNLMPSWIRNLCKINGKFIKEVDYSTLHPNIAIKIYGGSGRNINHTDVAKYLGIPRPKAKTEHLIFFNEKIEKMNHYNVFNYYFEKESDMLEKLYKDKLSSKYGYKITSRRLFKIEVEIMTKVIEELNAMNIYVIYVYDALCCEPNNKEIVKSVMNKIVKEFGVNTTAV